MTKLEQLYQDTILSHNRSPRNFKRLESYSHSSFGHNPLCGDSYQLFATIDGSVITDIGFYGEGCAISKASSSIMSEQVKGKSIEAAAELKDLFLKLLLATDEAGQMAAFVELPRKLQVFQGVREFPMRVKCATLIWRSLEAILQAGLKSEGEKEPVPVSTESLTPSAGRGTQNFSNPIQER